MTAKSRFASESVLSTANGKRMANKLSIACQQAHAFFLRLDEQQLIERVFVRERLGKHGGVVTGAQRQQLPIHRFGKRQRIRIERRPNRDVRVEQQPQS